MTNHEGSLLLHPFVTNIILPFVLIFAVVFAILQKSQILGKDKKRIDALVALVIGLMVVSFGYATGVIVSLMPFLAVSVVIILIFMIIYGMTFKEDEGFKMSNGLKTTVGILAGIGLIIAVLVATGSWNYVLGLLGFVAYTDEGSSIFTTILFLLIIAGAVYAVLAGSKSGGGKDKKKEGHDH